MASGHTCVSRDPGECRQLGAFLPEQSDEMGDLLLGVRLNNRGCLASQHKGDRLGMHGRVLVTRIKIECPLYYYKPWRSRRLLGIVILILGE
jgi:hypothetical protein